MSDTPAGGTTASDLDEGPPEPPTLDRAAMDAARRRWATRAKPPGALGDLEDLGVHLAGVTGSCPPPSPRRPAVALFAGDHGVVHSGASAWPQEITAAMVATIAAGGAAINAIARVAGASVTVVDVGVATPLPAGPPPVADGGTGSATGGSPDPTLIDRRVRAGTGDLSTGPAMSTGEASQAIDVGRSVAAELVESGGADCLVGGEMGIGNTTPSAALIAACTGLPATELTGPGAGEPADGLDHKRRLIETGLARAGSSGRPLDLLAELGGLEIAALAGLQIEAAERRVPFVVDGVIALAALCVADRLAPGTASLAIAGHRSTEPAATAALEHLGLRPLLDLGLCLGEGTGAALAIPLIQAAAAALSDMADLPAG